MSRLPSPPSTPYGSQSATASSSWDVPTGPALLLLGLGVLIGGMVGYMIAPTASAEHLAGSPLADEAPAASPVPTEGRAVVERMGEALSSCEGDLYQAQDQIAAMAEDLEAAGQEVDRYKLEAESRRAAQESRRAAPPPRRQASVQVAAPPPPRPRSTRSAPPPPPRTPRPAAVKPWQPLLTPLGPDMIVAGTVHNLEDEVVRGRLTVHLLQLETRRIVARETLTLTLQPGLNDWQHTFFSPPSDNFTSEVSWETTD